MNNYPLVAHLQSITTAVCQSAIIYLIGYIAADSDAEADEKMSTFIKHLFKKLM